MKNSLLNSPLGINKFKWNFLVLRRLFDTGYSLTNYFKYAIALFGLTSSDIKTTLILAVVYGLFCLLLGYIWFRYGLAEIDNEIGNRFNWFIKEVREAIKKNGNI